MIYSLSRLIIQPQKWRWPQKRRRPQKWRRPHYEHGLNMKTTSNWKKNWFRRPYPARAYTTLVVLVYLGLSPAISGKLGPFRAISRYLGLSLAMSVYLGLSLYLWKILQIIDQPTNQHERFLQELALGCPAFQIFLNFTFLIQDPTPFYI